MPDIDIKRRDDVPLLFTFSSQNLSVNFTVSGLTVLPTNGAIYKLGSTIFTVLSSTSTLIKTVSSDGTTPASTGTLTKLSGTGDSSINYTSLITSNAVDLTGATLYFYVKVRDADLDSAALIYVNWNTHIDPVNGVTSYKIPHTATNITPGSYRYELQIKNQVGEIMSSDTANFRVYQDLVQTIL